MPHVRIRLPGGLLKLKTRAWLRRYEQEREVPVWRVFGIYIIWLSDRSRR